MTIRKPISRSFSGPVDGADLDKALSPLAEAIDEVLDIPWVQGVLIENTEVTTSGLDIYHGLRRVPRGWFLVRKNANADVWDTALDNQKLSLDASATVTVSLWVF